MGEPNKAFEGLRAWAASFRAAVRQLVERMMGSISTVLRIYYVQRDLRGRFVHNHKGKSRRRHATPRRYLWC